MLIRTICVLLIAAPLTLPLAACGGSDSSDAATSESKEDNAQDTARAKLQQCLRDQGLEPPAGRGSGGGSRQQLSDADREELQEALDGPCVEFRDDAYSTSGVEDEQEFEDAAVRFQACMRDEGIDVPSQAGGGSGAPRGQIDPNDPEVQEALEKCQDLRPQGGR